MSTRLLIFDDGRGRFGPLTDRRSAFSLRTGALNNRVRIEVALGVMATDLRVEPGLAAVYRQAETDARVNEPLCRQGPVRFHIRALDGLWHATAAAGDAELLLVNGRWTGGPPLPASIVSQLPPGHVLIQPDGQIIAARLPCDEAQSFVDRGFVPDSASPRQAFDRNVLLNRPWDILARLEETLVHDLSGHEHIPLFKAANVTTLGDYPIRVAPDARVHPMVVLNSEKGPITIADGVIVGSFCVIAGPCHIGAGTIVQPHTHLRANTAIGPHCLVAGEISHSVIQGYSNKAHTGYLGNSLVGEWVNLGADTNVSNLKNTYGSVRMQLERGGQAEDSGQSKLGPVIGDFTRTAIGSRLMTGSCLSTGTMLAVSGLGPKFTDRFAFITDGGEQRYDIDKFLAAARTALSRRKVTMTPADEARLRELAGA